MATYDYSKGGTSGIPNRFAGRVAVIERYFDFAVIAAERSAASQAALASGDIIQAIDVPADSHVLLCTLKVIKAEGAAANVGVGDGAGTSGYMAAVDLNATGVSTSAATAANSVAVGGGKYYTVADTIDLILNSNSIDVAQILLTAVVIDCTKTEVLGGAAPAKAP